MSERIEQLRQAVETMHHCKASHVQSVPVVEMFGQQEVWEGVVESFALTGHPQAKRCYAWNFKDGTETRYVIVLEIPPVSSAQTAVRVSIVDDVNRRRKINPK